MLFILGTVIGLIGSMNPIDCAVSMFVFYDPVALWNVMNTLTDLLPGLDRPRVPVLWTVFSCYNGTQLDNVLLQASLREWTVTVSRRIACDCRLTLSSRESRLPFSPMYTKSTSFKLSTRSPSQYVRWWQNPNKNTICCQIRAIFSPVLSALGWILPSSGTLYQVYGAHNTCIWSFQLLNSLGPSDAYICVSKLIIIV